jgi:peptidoglycan hydrolase CwlO-like protein
MTGMQIEVGILISVLGVALSACTFFVGRMTSAKNGGREQGQVLTELGYIKKGIDSLDDKMEKMEKQYTRLDVRVSKLEEAMKIYHPHGGEV